VSQVEEEVCVRLLGGFSCMIGKHEVELTELPASLVVQLALEGRTLSRRSVLARLWPDLPLAQAGKRLRQTLWRIRSLTDGRLLRVTTETISLMARVDLPELEFFAKGIAGEGHRTLPAEWWLLTEELLPGWDDEVAIRAQDRWNQLRLLALQDLAGELLRAGDIMGAIEAATQATRVDELSESSHRTLVGAHLARADMARAQLTYRHYSRMLHRELGVRPSSEFTRLLAEGA